MAPRAKRPSKPPVPQESTSEVQLAKQPCDIGDEGGCGSSDAMAVYDDGHRHCFSCGATAQAGRDGSTEEQAAPKPLSSELAPVVDSSKAVALTRRKITQATCRHWRYLARTNSKGEAEHVAVYCNEHGHPVAAKVRNTGKDGTDKDFFWVGSNRKLPLYGQWLWGQGGKQVVVTEGEIDALTVSQLFGNKWPVVSVPNGADNAKKDIARAIPWLTTFDKVIFAFDMDPQGRTAAEECAKLLPPGLAFIAHLPDKDPNASLLAGDGEALIRSIWNAKGYRPDGIVCAADLVDKALNPPVSGMPWPWQFLTDWTYGRRYGEVYTLGAGTGVGKSDFINTVIAHTLTTLPDACAVFSWEAGPVQTFKAIAGKVARRRFHVPDPDHVHWTQQELSDTLHQTWNRRLFLNDSFGAADWESVKERIRFLVHSEGVRHVVLDPLTALAAAAIEEERVFLERFMAEIAGLAQELQICVYLVSHLATPEGTPHEEGGRVTIRHFKGARAIGQWSFFMFGMERDQQATDAAEAKSTLFRCLKDRPTGDATGKTVRLYYDSITGYLDPENDGSVVEMPQVEALELEMANG